MSFHHGAWVPKALRESLMTHNLCLPGGPHGNFSWSHLDKILLRRTTSSLTVCAVYLRRPEFLDQPTLGRRETNTGTFWQEWFSGSLAFSLGFLWVASVLGVHLGTWLQSDMCFQTSPPLKAIRTNPLLLRSPVLGFDESRRPKLRVTKLCDSPKVWVY